MRSGRVSSRATTTARLLRTPHSTLRICLLVAACTPVTTRPDFFPDPRAATVVLLARPERVTADLPALVAAESLRIERTNVRDGYLESSWYDTRSKRSRRGMGDVSNLAASVKVRCWADPHVPGQTRLTVEVVYRPRYDPSRSERDLEVLVPQQHAGHAIGERLIEQLKKKYGTPDAKPAATGPPP